MMYLEPVDYFNTSVRDRPGEAYRRQLSQADVNVYASSGVTDGRGSFGYVIYIRPEEMERAEAALGL